VCRPGTTAEICGLRGVPCRECQPEETCEEGICNDPLKCGPESCGDCCADSICKEGVSVDACGIGGDRCSVCGRSQICKARRCRVDPQSEWYLTVVSAAIDGTLGTWDMLFNTAPDPFVVISVGPSFSESTRALDDTYRPHWDEVIGVVNAGEVLTHDLSIEVRDEDLAGSEPIGVCLVRVPDADFASGVVLVDHCLHPGNNFGYIEFLKLRLAPK
jgi:hypothetical protein